MRFDKFTLKSQEALQSSQQLAEKYGHQQIEPEHLVRAILDQPEGVIPSLLGKTGADRSRLILGFDTALEDVPRVSGGGFGEVHISPRTKAILDKAFAEAKGDIFSNNRAWRNRRCKHTAVSNKLFQGLFLWPCLAHSCHTSCI